ncbi:MAG: hypothetical protein R2830_19480 [Saprospiraceae bacterium]
MGTISNTHPEGSVLPPVNPIQTTLGVSNVSFVAQTVDWVPSHLYATIKAAYEHEGFSFVKISMRVRSLWPNFRRKSLRSGHRAASDARKRHPAGRSNRERMFTHHQPTTRPTSTQPVPSPRTWKRPHLGLFYQNKNALRYDLYGAHTWGIRRNKDGGD